MRLSFILAATALLSAGLVARADTTYTVDETFSGLSAVGTITTDGNLGTLSGSDILDYTLTVSEGANSATFSDGGSYGEGVFGSNLTATSTGLFFNFDGGDSYFGLGQPNVTLLCFGDDGGCNGDGSTGVQVYINGTIADSPTLSGTDQIATVAATPEPSSIALLGTGVLGFAGIVRRRLV